VLHDIIADVAHAKQLGLGSGENFRRLAEMFQQRPGAHRPDALNQV
jgi:hypothetical protein